MPAETGIRRIWVRCPNWVGDMVMALPTLRALRESFPEARITLGGAPHLRQIPDGSGWFDEWIDLGTFFWRTVGTIRKDRFDLALILPRSFRSALEARLGGIPERVGFSDQGRDFLLTRRPAPERGPDHSLTPVYNVDAYLRLVEAAGGRVRHREIRMSETPDGIRGAEALLKDGPRPWTLFIPGAAFGSSKCWPAEHFTSLGRKVLARFGGTVAVLGGPGEDEATRRIAGGIGRGACAFPAREAPLSVLKSLLRRADCVVTNDTGPRHIAVAFDVPGVALLGPMDPRYTQTAQGRLAVLREPVACSPCNLPVCPIDHRCLVRITPERVFAELERILIR